MLINVKHIERPDAVDLDEVDLEIIAGEKILLVLEITPDLSKTERMTLGRAFGYLHAHMLTHHQVDLFRPPIDIVRQ